MNKLSDKTAKDLIDDLTLMRDAYLDLSYIISDLMQYGHLNFQRYKYHFFLGKYAGACFSAEESVKKAKAELESKND